ncbi:hypothetical protein BKG61_17675 [Mycobacterium syngnathidarum]|uniref:Uncharacterized protein n=1 Tax=Mycobacterium syngnathidarum TaxID=1908205 RepID=A0A1S1JWE4_9MYCO|nr:hypothetical protein BKG61_17675 [Mycobacterium syngnathidarum]
MKEESVSAKVSPDTNIGFGGDGHPDTEWLGCHETAARTRGQSLRAAAFAWLIAEFNRHVVLLPDIVGDSDPAAGFTRLRARAGSYRLFEFAAALEERRTARIAQEQWHAAFDQGGADAARTLEHDHPTYEAVAKDEIHACIGNFLAVIGYAAEFQGSAPLSRWIDTVPGDIPDTLRVFVDAYLSVLRSSTVLPSHDEALRRYSRELSNTHGASVGDFEAAAGRAHAWQVVLFEVGR